MPATRSMRLFRPFREPGTVKQDTMSHVFELTGLEGIGRSTCACKTLKAIVEALPDSVYTVGAAAKYPLVHAMKGADVTWKRAVQHQQRLLLESKAGREPDPPLSAYRWLFAIKFRGQTRIEHGTIRKKAHAGLSGENPHEVTFPVDFEGLSLGLNADDEVGDWAHFERHEQAYLAAARDVDITVMVTDPNGRSVRLGGIKLVEEADHFIDEAMSICFEGDGVKVAGGVPPSLPNTWPTPYGVLSNNGSLFVLTNWVYYEDMESTLEAMVPAWLLAAGVDPP